LAAVSGNLALKPFQRPRLWSGLWLLAVSGVIVLSLIPPPPLPPLPSGSDKVEHLFGYFLLAAGAVQLFAARTTLLAVGAGLIALGVGLEFAQGALTATRMQDPLDALANTAGVLLGLATMATRGRDLLLRFDARRKL
jgi:VanZ family protein